MNSLLQFFIQIGKLKQAKRSGWLAYGIKSPETTADHIFRATILGWVLNKEKGLDESKIIKTILVHHLYEVYINDTTPYGYLLPKGVASQKEKTLLKEILKNPPPFNLIDEQKRLNRRHQEEENSVEKLISRLDGNIKKEIETLWQGYLNRKTKIGKFAWQAAKAETFLQAMEYWKKEGKIEHKLWNRWAKKALKDPIVSKFKKEIDRNFLNSGKKKNRNTTTEVMNFIIEIGKLKRLKRTGWILRGVKNPETVAQHTFQMTIISWFLGETKGLDTNKTVKIALIHDLCEVYAGDQTPYDPILGSDKKNAKKIMEKPPRVPYAKRLEWLLQKRAKEWKAIVKLTSRLPKALQDEIIELWVDFEEGLTKEGRFVSQVDKMVNLFQAIEYWKKDKKFPIIPWWIDIKERIDDPLLLKFMEELDKEFAIAKQGRVYKKK
jgi:putative hydrolase of HD superfamily